jgi:hypothetical protein
VVASLTFVGCRNERPDAWYQNNRSVKTLAGNIADGIFRGGTTVQSNDSAVVLEVIRPLAEAVAANIISQPAFESQLLRGNPVINPFDWDNMRNFEVGVINTSFRHPDNPEGSYPAPTSLHYLRTGPWMAELDSEIRDGRVWYYFHFKAHDIFGNTRLSPTNPNTMGGDFYFTVVIRSSSNVQPAQ